jgi:hypothetical protein
MAQLNSPYLRGCLHPDVNINNPFTFRYKILPSICKLLYEAIEEKLNSCYSVSIIPDGWTGQYSNTEFLGVAFQITNGAFEKEIIIVGMEVMENGHSAEEVQKAIEKIVNKYKFDRSKVRCK